MKNYAKRRGRSLALKVALASTTLIVTTQMASAAGGLPDKSFGNNGERITRFDVGHNHFDIPSAILAGPGGSTYQVGTLFADHPEFPSKIAHAVGIVRVLHNGKPDASYGIGGKVTHMDPSMAQVTANAAALDSSGRIITAGRTWDGVSSSSFPAVCRFNVAGEPDLDFGDPSTPGCRFGLTSYSSQAVGVALDSAGNIFVAVNGAYDPSSVLKLDSDGEFDPLFNGGSVQLAEGIRLTDIAVNFQDDLVASGRTGGFGEENVGILQMLDGESGAAEDFGNNGVVHFNQVPGGGTTSFEAIALLSDGSIIAGGRNFEYADDDWIVAKFTPAGKLDESFGDSGLQLIAISDNDWTNVYSIHDVLLDEAEKIYIGLTLTYNGDVFDQYHEPQIFSHFAVKLDPTGSVDSSYGLQGYAQAHFSKPGHFHGAKLAKQGERILIGAATMDDNKSDVDPDFAIARLTHGLRKADFKVTPEFGPNGVLKPSLPVFVAHSDSQEFQVIPKPGYALNSISGCNGELFGKIYITGPTVSACLVKATFKKL